MSERSPVVLVVEDEKQIRQFVRAALEQEGCRVYEAGTSAQGLIEAGQQKPDLLVLDLGLPDGNGITSSAPCAVGQTRRSLFFRRVRMSGTRCWRSMSVPMIT